MQKIRINTFPPFRTFGKISRFGAHRVPSVCALRLDPERTLARPATHLVPTRSALGLDPVRTVSRVAPHSGATRLKV